MQRYYKIIIAAILAILLIAVMILLLISYEPVEVPVYEEMPLPTLIVLPVESSEPEPEETEAPPAITPPADSAASGSDIILQPVEPSSDTDLTPVGSEDYPTTPEE